LKSGWHLKTERVDTTKFIYNMKKKKHLLSQLLKTPWIGNFGMENTTHSWRNYFNWKWILGLSPCLWFPLWSTNISLSHTHTHTLSLSLSSASPFLCARLLTGLSLLKPVYNFPPPSTLGSGTTKSAWQERPYVCQSCTIKRNYAFAILQL